MKRFDKIRLVLPDGTTRDLDYPDAKPATEANMTYFTQFGRGKMVELTIGDKDYTDKDLISIKSYREGSAVGTALVCHDITFKGYNGDIAVGDVITKYYLFVGDNAQLSGELGRFNGIDVVGESDPVVFETSYDVKNDYTTVRCYDIMYKMTKKLEDWVPTATADGRLSVDDMIRQIMATVLDVSESGITSTVSGSVNPVIPITIADIQGAMLEVSKWSNIEWGADATFRDVLDDIAAMLGCVIRIPSKTRIEYRFTDTGYASRNEGQAEINSGEKFFTAVTINRAILSTYWVDFELPDGRIQPVGHETSYGDNKYKARFHIKNKMRVMLSTVGSNYSHVGMIALKGYTGIAGVMVGSRTGALVECDIETVGMVIPDIGDVIDFTAFNHLYRAAWSSYCLTVDTGIKETFSYVLPDTYEVVGAN